MDKLQQLETDLKATEAALDVLLAGDSLDDVGRAEHDRLLEHRAGLVKEITKEKKRVMREKENECLAIEIEEARQADEELQAKKKAAAEKTALRQARTVAANGPGSNRLTDRDHSTNGAPVALLAAEPRRSIIPNSVRQVGSPKNFKGVRNGYTAMERAYRFGMYVLAKLTTDMPNRYQFRQAVEYANRELGGIGHDPLGRNLAAVGSNDTSGYSFLIPEEFGTDLIDLREQYGIARQLFKVVPMSSDMRTDPRRQSGLTAYFIGENAPGTESNKIWNDVLLVAKKLVVLSRYSAEVAADSVISVGDDLAGEIAYAFALKEDQCAFIGDGTSTYGGIIGVRTKLDSIDGAGTDSAGLVTAATTGSWGAIILADFSNVAGKLPQYADSSGEVVWLCHKSFYYSTMQRLEMAVGGATAMEISAPVGGRTRPLFLGYPVQFSQVMPAVTASTGVVALLGNFKLGCSFGDRQQDSIAFSEHATIGGENVFERNQIAIRGTERFDVNCHDVGDATNPGPVCGLKVG